MAWLLVSTLALVAHLGAAIQGIDFVFASDPETPRAVLTNPGGGVPNGTEQFTFCVQMNLRAGKNQQPVNPVSYSSRDADNTNEFLLELSYSRSYTSLYIHSAETLIDVLPPADQWVHVCAMWDSQTGQADFYFNGMHAGTGSKRVMQGHKIGGTGFLVLGQDQDWFDGGYDPDNGITGRMTQFHFWDVLLDKEGVRAAKNCNLKGNIIQWEQTSWSLSGRIGIEDTTAPCFNRDYYNLDPCSDSGSEEEENKENTDPTGYHKHNTTESESDCGLRRHPLAFDLLYPPDQPNARAVLLDSKSVSLGTKELTFGFWIFLNKPSGEAATAFAYNSVQNVREIGMEFELRTFQTNVTIGGSSATFSVLPPQQEWTHVCVTWSGIQGGTTRLFMNGSSIDRLEGLNPSYVIRRSGTLVVGQAGHPPDEVDLPKGLEGRITDVYVWDRVLSDREVAAIAKCNSANVGNVVNWNKARWEFEDAVIYDTSTLTCTK